jgi:hypothetical protein
VYIGENSNVSRVYRLLSVVIKDDNSYAIPKTLNEMYILSTADIMMYYFREFEMKLVAVETLHLQLINFEKPCQEF